MIYTAIPYCPPAYGKNLGLAYNLEMQTVPEGQWKIFIDHDASWTTRTWYEQIEHAIEEHPDAGFFTCHTNRVFCHWQTEGVPDALKVSHDMIFHRQYGSERAKRYGSTAVKVDDNQDLFSGVVIVLSKAVWQDVPFPEGLCGVDNLWHLEILRKGYEVYYLPGVYVYHWYRADGKGHLEGSHNPVVCRFIGPGKCPVCGEVLGRFR